MARYEKSQAKEVWAHIKRLRKPFTANDVADKCLVDIDTIRHYLSFWKDKGSVEASGKVEECGKVGRPRVLWAVTSKDFISVWR